MNIYLILGIYDKVRIDFNQIIYIVFTYNTLLGGQIKKL